MIGRCDGCGAEWSAGWPCPRCEAGEPTWPVDCLTGDPIYQDDAPVEDRCPGCLVWGDCCCGWAA